MPTLSAMKNVPIILSQENHFAASMSAESHAAITIDTPER